MFKKINSLFSAENHRNIISFSFLLYVFSLFLVGIISSNDGLPGIFILFFLPIAWLGILEDFAVIAIYANLFFLYSLVTKDKNKASSASIIGLVLASGVLIFREYPAGTSESIAVVYSWGWGAVLWYTSILLSTMSFSVRNDDLSLKSARRVIAVYLTCIVLPITCLSIYQHAHISEQVKEKYLPFGTAFTVMPLSEEK